MTLTVAIAGLGAVCRPVAEWLDQGVPGLTLTAISAGNEARAHERIAHFKHKPKVVPLAELAQHADIIVEGLPPALYFDLAEPVIEAGKVFVSVTVTRLLERPELIERARETGAKNHRADRRVGGVRCGSCCQLRHHSFACDGNSQAAERPGQSAVCGRARDRFV